MMTVPPPARLLVNPRGLMAAYYAEARQARENGIPVAWLTGMAPVEPLRAMGVAVVYPENHAAMCGARRASLELCEAAEMRGYSADLCSYARCSLGSIFMEESPVEGLPRPDFLLSASNFCITVTKWYEALSRHFGVPHIHIDTPFAGDAPTPAAITYVVEQLEDLIGFLERFLGRPFDHDRLRETVAQADKAGALWHDVLQTGRAIPAPFTAFDGFSHMAPMVAMRGLESTESYYARLYAEVQQRIALKDAALPGERFRLFWGGIPIWCSLKSIPDLVNRYGGCFVASEYANSWAFRLSQERPLESMASAYMTVITNLSLERRASIWQTLIEEFAVDGFVMHSNRSCRPGSLMQYELKALVEGRTGVPGVIIDADMVDPRAYSDTQVSTRLETFMRNLRASKRA